MKVIGTQNAHNLITTSSDGLVCSWLTDMLAQPQVSRAEARQSRIEMPTLDWWNCFQETLELVNASHPKTNEVSITCFDFPDDEASTFWIGTEEGGVHQAHRYDRAGSKAGLNLKDSYRGHSGPVTSLDFHPLRGPVDFSDLFLTTSVDWTVKLWRARSTSKSAAGLASAVMGNVNHVSPLMTFEESDDHVYDAKWHPAHPAVFGTVDGSGKFEVWNLNADTEVRVSFRQQFIHRAHGRPHNVQIPVASITVGDGHALNKMSWDRKDGKHVALGGSDGNLSVYHIGETAVAKESDWTDLQRTVQAMLHQGGSGMTR
jgi:dynein intermediate chain